MKITIDRRALRLAAGMGAAAVAVSLGGCLSSGGSTDCQITFSRASGSQPGQQWHFQVSLTWNVTATNAALTGPPTITRTGGQALTVLEAQAVAGNPRNND